MSYFTQSVNTNELTGWRSPAVLLMIMAGAMQLSFAAWWNLMNNFAVQELDFSGREIGIQQSIREIPGFLSFLAVYLLLLMREQTLAYVSLLLLGVGVAVTGYFPTALGFYVTTLIMSIGFHYYETMAQSLSLQWLPKATAAASMGKIIAVGAFAQLIAYGLIFVAWKTFDLSFTFVFAIAGGLTLVVLAFLMMAYPHFKEGVPQHKKLILRKRYWLYYALTFMGGARRQIFMVFAGFLMVERFGYDVHEIAGLFLINGVFSMILAPKIGHLIVRFGERKALILEYIGLIGVFVAYAFVSQSLGRRRSLRDRSRFLRSGDCHEDLLPENRRSEGHRAHCRCRLHDQSHRSRFHSRPVRLRLADITGSRLPGGRGHGRRQPCARLAHSEQPRGWPGGRFLVPQTGGTGRRVAQM